MQFDPPRRVQRGHAHTEETQMTSTATAPTRTTRRMHTDDEIDAAILSALTDLAPNDGDLVRWSRVRAQLPGGCGYWQAHEAQHRLWRAGQIVLVQVHGTPWVGLADECSRMADAACARRGEPKRVVMV
ncbi:hypothetical protein GS4_19_00550 [Gordonia soli NBRC 108243]|uniref:Uncharacterized protein n=2 Tax=Gordonia soli TaxID=320799 RepID=M0QJU1_9ACTN|nr:hypothetical protein GS4_19_00550 [Gordonia soli NBRC 108243]